MKIINLFIGSTGTTMGNVVKALLMGVIIFFVMIKIGAYEEHSISGRYDQNGYDDYSYDSDAGKEWNYDKISIFWGLYSYRNDDFPSLSNSWNTVFLLFISGWLFLLYNRKEKRTE